MRSQCARARLEIHTRAAVNLRLIGAVLDSPLSHGEKMNELQALLGDDKQRQILFIKLVFLLESLSQIHGIQKRLESTEPMLHCMYHMVNVLLQTEMASKSTEDVSLGTETSTLLSMLSASEARTLKSTLNDFNITLARKWEATCERNLSPEVLGLRAYGKRP